MNYLLPVLIGVVFVLIRMLITDKNRSIAFWLIPFYFILVSFETPYLVYFNEGGGVTGTLKNALFLDCPIVVGMAVYAIASFKPCYKLVLTQNARLMLLLAISIFIISTANPSNSARLAVLVLINSIIGPLLFCAGIRRLCSQNDVGIAIFEGFASVAIIQFILSICYPVLGIISVANLFSESSSESSMRRGITSAVGTFPHPGILGLFCVISGVYFWISYLNGYRKRFAFGMFVIIGITLWLTHSRTSMVTLAVVAMISWSLSRRTKIVKALFISLIVSTIFMAANLIGDRNDLSKGSDVNVQVENRNTHYLLAWEMIRAHPIIGVGINSHLAYEGSNSKISEYIESESIGAFFTENPIHNIHLIVFSETGVVGIAVWLAFLAMLMSGKMISKIDSNIKSLDMYYSSIKYITLGVSLYGLTGWGPFRTGMLEIESLLIGMAFVAGGMRNDTHKA